MAPSWEPEFGHRSFRVDDRTPKSGFFLVLAPLTDNVGDVVITLFGLLDERSLFGLLDFDILVARGCVALLALSFSIGVFERHQLNVGVFRHLRLGFLGRRACSGGSGCRGSSDRGGFAATA